VYNPAGATGGEPAPGEVREMKILGFCGSPRNGNTEWMIEKLLEGARSAGAETEHILLRDKDIRLCTGCLSCEMKDEETPGVCVIKDDMEPLLEKMLAADAFVFGTPVYFYMLSGLLKNVMDRTIPVWPLLKGKSAAGVAVAEDSVGKALENLRTYADVCGLEWAGDVSAFAKTAGEIAGNEGIGAALAGLGRRLVETTKRE
jgi:multimeric flavodoxin WrbA